MIRFGEDTALSGHSGSATRTGQHPSRCRPLCLASPERMRDRRYPSGQAGICAVPPNGAVANTIEEESMSTPTKPSIVFCHGIWADGSCWNKLTGPLQAEGYEGISAQYGLDTNEADGAPTLATLGRVHSPAILVGHSYGGAVITAAGTDDRVAGLVYISALGPDETETSQSEQDKFPVTPAFTQAVVADGRVWMKPSAIGCFCGDLPEEEQKIVWATANPPAATLFAHNAPGVAWRTRPSWYIVANNDQAVHPDLERAAAKRMGATTYDIDSSHVPMLSHPDYVLDVIRAAAAGI